MGADSVIPFRLPMIISFNSASLTVTSNVRELYNTINNTNNYTKVSATLYGSAYINFKIDGTSLYANKPGWGGVQKNANINPSSKIEVIFAFVYNSGGESYNVYIELHD